MRPSIGACCVATATAIAACGGAAVAPPPTTAPQAQAQIQGKELYDKYCALCHAADGVGYASDNANALSNPQFLSTASDAFLYLAIDRGRPGTPMAAYGARYGGPLDPADMKRIIAYLRGFQGVPTVELDGTPRPGDSKLGAPIYQRDCAACHGDRGQGVTAVSLNNPLFLGSASDGFIRYAIKHGRSHTPMPGFEAKLSDVELDHVTRFIRSWASTVPDKAAGELPPSFEQIVINPKGSAPTFSPLREGRYLPAAELKAALEGGARVVLLDARPTSDWLKSHIPGALPVPYYQPDKMVDSLPRDGTWIVSYCGCPHAASGKVMDVLRERGFKNTAVIDEGVFVWMQRGYPMTYGNKP